MITISLFIIWMCYGVAHSGDFREKVFNAPCGPESFKCLNNICISRNLFCNGVDNCGDNSDEKYCSGISGNCPSAYPFHKCYRMNKCIPEIWKCDGVIDCSYNSEDEINCETSATPNLKEVKMARAKAVRWILDQAKNRTSITTSQWGHHVRKTSVALYLADPTFVSSNLRRREIAYELSIELLSRLALRKLRDVSTSDLSSYINALLVTCLDPRKFHSINMVKELRSRVNAQNFSNPYDLLALCNAGDKITKKDVGKITEAFGSAHREFWTETQAISVMALACAGNQPGSSFSLNDLTDYTAELKQKQYRNGTVENLQTTALVMQALFSSESEDDENTFDEEKALQQILREQKEDGSFGNVINTYYVLPVLSYKSLVNISSDHCVPYTKDEDTVLQELMNVPGPKIRVRYSLWLGDERDVERTLKLKVPANTSFYGVIEVASGIDSQYRYQYVVKNGKPYVNAISGIQDDPESGKFWFPYIFNGTQHSPVTISPADLIAKDNDHVIMWYQSGSWIE